MRNPSRIVLCVAAITWDAAAAFAEDSAAFRVTFDAGVRSEAATGRLVIFLIKEGATVGPRAEPADGPFYEDPQPIFGVDVEGLMPGATLEVGRGVRGFPTSFEELPAGAYRAQAVFDLHQLNSDWRREPGNLYSEVVTFTKSGAGGAAVELPLGKVVVNEAPPPTPGVEWIEARSALLSEFRGTEMVHHAGVVHPQPFDPARKYPAVYVVPGFGGDHRFAERVARMGSMGPFGMLRPHAFIICLDPESPNGHTLFADSANNGPCGRALVEELLPALERRFPLIAEPAARIVTGHSSGGWSAVWLATTYPETFGWCFAGSPDPVDFHTFQKINIYERENLFFGEHGEEVASNIQGGNVLMTIRQENAWEEARGPRNSSGQQWDSWQAVFGLRGEGGRPAALFDPETGLIDRAVADQYKVFDITDRLARDPARFGPIFEGHVRIIVGGADEWDLHEAVRRLGDRLRALDHPMTGEKTFGKITIVPGADHGTVMMAPEYRSMGTQMLDVLKRGGYMRE
jgi:hypothetical protein